MPKKKKKKKNVRVTTNTDSHRTTVREREEFYHQDFINCRQCINNIVGH